MTLIDSILHDNTRQVNNILEAIVREAPPQDRGRSWIGYWETRYVEKLLREAEDDLVRTSDTHFASGLEDISKRLPILQSATDTAIARLKAHFEIVAPRLSKKLAHIALRIQEDDFSKKIGLEIAARNTGVLRDSGRSLIEKINMLSKVSPSSWVPL